MSSSESSSENNNNNVVNNEEEESTTTIDAAREEINELENAVAQEEKETTGKVTPTKTLSGVAAVKGPWQDYYDKLREIDAGYMQNVMARATQEEWVIPIEQVDSEGEPIGKYTMKKYKRQKISVRRWNKLEEIRARFAVEKDRVKSQELLGEVYFQCAQGYFGMTKDDYINASWEDMKLAMDACNFRTVRGLPYSQGGSNNSTTQAKQG